jgi:hypothetical protein
MGTIMDLPSRWDATSDIPDLAFGEVEKRPAHQQAEL